MKCSFKFRSRLILLIALAISLSNSFYAQHAVNRNTAELTNDDAVARTTVASTNDENAVHPNAAELINDDCSRAILLETKLMSTYLKSSMVGAGRSVNNYRSICEEPNEIQQAVWFQTLMPSSGKLNVYLQCENEMPRVTVFYGECENLKYLACDVNSNISSKVMTIIAKQLVEKPIFIRVATTNTLTKDFEIKVENPSIPSVSVKDFSTNEHKKGISCQWSIMSKVDSFQTQLLHSIDGINFKTISSEEGQNRNTYEQHYFIHERPEKGDNFYRLVLVLEEGVQRTIDEQLVIVDKFNKKIRIKSN